MLVQPHMVNASCSFHSVNVVPVDCFNYFVHIRYLFRKKISVPEIFTLLHAFFFSLPYKKRNPARVLISLVEFHSKTYQYFTFYIFSLNFFFCFIRLPHCIEIIRHQRNQRRDPRCRVCQAHTGKTCPARYNIDNRCPGD